MRSVAILLALTGMLYAQAPPRDNVVSVDNVAPPAVGTARISGRVVAADTGNPIARAQLQISSPALAKGRGATTDANGRYEVTGLPAGRYKIVVMRLGFVSIEYGQTRPFESGRDLEVLDGQTIDNINFALSRGGVITGRVIDHNGEPQAGIPMSAMRFSWGPSGTRTLERASSGGLFDRPVTDDLGQFRIYGLMPGSYLVAAGHVPGVLPGLEGTLQGTTYYPGTTNVDAAQPVEVDMGQEVPIHFSLVNARLARVAGTIVDSNGRPLAWRQIMLASRTETASGLRGGGTTRPDGSFEIANVAPGHYTIEVAPLRTEPSDHEFVSFPLTVDGQDITDLWISARRGATVTGRVIWEGRSPHPFATLRISIAPADQSTIARLAFGGGSGAGVVDAKNTFSIIGVHGHVVFRPSFTGRAETWNLKAVRFAGEDITDLGYNVTSDLDGIEVVMTDRETRVSGIARDARNQPVRDYVVVFLPAEVRAGINQTRYVQTARPDQEGRYLMRGLPPGDYVAAALESLVRDSHFNPELQKRIRAAVKPFTLKEGQEFALDLTLMK